MKLLLLACVVAVYAKHEQYEGFKSFFIRPLDLDQVNTLRALTDEFELDFLSPPTTTREGVVLVGPQYQKEFLDVLSKFNIPHTIHADNVKEQLEFDDQYMQERDSEIRFRSGRNMPYDNYQPLEVIDAYLDDIAARYPDRVTLVTPANSFEGRPIKYLRISTTNFTDESKPIIFIDGGIHAREWISPPTITYAIHKLVENVTDPSLVNNYDWILFPVVNPDGYKFSFDVTRFWRKTRSTDQNAISYLCPGVDGNRNYNFMWNTVGTSNNPCSDIFAGSRPFSEIETRVVDNILRTYLRRIALYLTMHSYGSMILYPWGHDGSLSANAFSLQSVGISMADAIYRRSLPHFPRYQVGNSVLVIQYAAAGASEDYAHSIGIPLTFTYELPGLASGLQGFHLNPRYILQVCEETWDGIAVGARRAAQLFARR